MKFFTLSILVPLFFFSCKKDTAVVDVPVEESTITSAADLYKISVKKITAGSIRYVNSEEGLRVRDNPGLESTAINKLPHKEKVEIIEVSDDPVEIDGISGSWVLVRAENIEGWVFGGYLVDSLERIESVKYTGTYRGTSVTIIERENIADYQLNEKLPDVENVQCEIEYSSGNAYLFRYNFPAWSQDSEFTAVTIRLPPEGEAFYQMDAEKGGGGTYIRFYLEDGHIRLYYNYYSYMSPYEEDETGVASPYSDEELEFELILERVSR